MAETNTSILFGATTLKSAGPTLTPYKLEAKAAGTERGNPDAVVASIPSLLMDGDRAEVTRFGNLVHKIAVTITGPTLIEVEQGEAALMAEVNKGRNTVTWTPPGLATSSVFDVVYSILDFRFDEYAENLAKRHFTLTLVCIPGARRDTPTVVVADPVPGGAPTVTSIDSCASATDWKATAEVTLSAAGGAIVADDVTTGSQIETPTYAVTVAAGEYVRLELEIPPLLPADTLQFSTPAGDDIAVRSVTWVNTYARRVYYYLAADVGSFTGTTITIPNLPVAAQMKIHDLSKVDRLPGYGPHQRAFTARIGGTARTAADLLIEAEDGLGDEVLVFTAPAGEAIDPPLRTWATSPATGDNTGTVSGSATDTDADGGFGSAIPVSALPPGSHLVLARMRRPDGAATVNVTAVAQLTDSPWADSDVTTVTETTAVAMTTTWALYPLAVIELPTAEVDPTSGATVGVGVGDIDEVGFLIDDVYICNLDTGVLTRFASLEVGGDTPSKIEIRSATIDRADPQWFVGTAGTDDDNVDASARATSNGTHEFKPGLMSVFVMTPGAEEQTVTAEGYDRFQHNATTAA